MARPISTQSTKKSLMLWLSTIAYFAARTKDGAVIEWTEATNTSVQHLAWLCGELTPDFTVSEWGMLTNVYARRGVTLTPPYRIASDILDGAGVISLEELSPQYAALAKKAKTLSQPAQFAALDVVRQFLCVKQEQEQGKTFSVLIAEIVGKELRV
jgi:hypothetical protein